MRQHHPGVGDRALSSRQSVPHTVHSRGHTLHRRHTRCNALVTASLATSRRTKGVVAHRTASSTAPQAASGGAAHTTTTAGVAPAPAQQQHPTGRRPARSAVATAAVPAIAPSYSADMAADEWSRRPVPVVARLLEIAAAFGSWWVKTALHKDRQKAAAEMRRVLVELGPAFVKIGQALSSRPDVLPPEYITELEVLQDRIPPFSNDEALQVIEEELGLPWTEVFSSLSPCPVAAASLGQVYRGRLVSNGAEVAVKVQRPGVVEAIGRDTYILRYLAAIARKQAKLNTDLPALVDEWASSLFKELDYRREAANAIRFAELFSFMPEVVVPKMYTEWTTARVLVMEWIEGERLRSASKQAPAATAAVAAAAAGSSGSSSAAQVAMRQQLIQQQRSSPEQVAEDLRLVEIGVRCSLEQMLEEGFYHADPHPGNLLKTQDGRLAYIDFGMMGSIEPSVRQALIRATLHLVNREYELLAEDFVALGLLPRGSDMDQVIPALTGVFQMALAGGVSNISFSTLSADLGRTMYKYSFRLPPYYTLLVRSLSVLEGIALASDPNYKVLGAAYPWVSRRLLLTTNSPELTATLDNLLYDSSGRFNFDRLESLLEQAAKARVEANAGARQPAHAVSPSHGQPSSSTASSSSSSRVGSSTTVIPYSNGASSPSAAAAASPGSIVPSGNRQQQEQGGILASVAAAIGGALAGPEGSELLLSSLQLLSGSNGSTGGGWQQQVSGRGSAAAAAGGPLALVLSPEGRHIRGILEDELAKGLDAAWRLNLDRTLDAASERVEGALAFAASTPLGNTLVPQWLQEQVRQSSSSSTGDSSVSSSSSRYDSSISSSSIVGEVDSRPDLIESLLSLPRLAGEDDRVQVEGLQRLAVQLAAFSTLASSSSGAVAQQQQQQQQQMTPQQEANAAALQQVRQAALVLRWFSSEVQLLSPDAQREALAIPMRILWKLGSRVAARAVRAVLTPSTTPPPAAPTLTGVRVGVSAGRSAAVTGGNAPRSLRSSSTNSGTGSSPVVVSSSGNSSSSNGVVMAPIGPAVSPSAAAGRPAAVGQQGGNGKVLAADNSSISSSSRGRGRSTGDSSGSSSRNGASSCSNSSNRDGSSNGRVGVYSNGFNSSSSNNSSSSSSSAVDGEVIVGYQGVVEIVDAGGGAHRGSPLPSDGKGGLKGGRMVVLKEPETVVDAGV